MTWRYFDVVVLGRSLGALAAAALLARRDFHVLVLGQGSRPCRYGFEGLSFRRRAFTWLADSSPPWRRLLHELAQSPRFRRRLVPLDPMFSVVFPDRRLELAPDVELFAREIDREFPEVRQVVDELYATIAQVNSAADQVFERDAVWPPWTILERLETRRAASELPWVNDAARIDPLSRFPLRHPFREVVTLPAQFASHLATEPHGLPAFAMARLHGAWTRGLFGLPAGEDELTDFLVERVEAHGGVCRLDSKASSILVQRGRVAAILEEGGDEPTGTSHVITDLPGEAVADLALGQGITTSARREWPQARAVTSRFVASIVVRSAGLPSQLPEESFLVSSLTDHPDPRRPPIHLQRIGLCEPPEGSNGKEHTSLLVAEVLLPIRGALTRLEARESVLSALERSLPFVREHLVAVDSAHDGLPLWLYADGTKRLVDRIHVRATAPGAEPMPRQWSFEPLGYLDLAGEPVRGPIVGTFLVGPTVMPALGQEGELLAGWSAARLVTRKDKNRQRMRRQMWRRIETG